uniref:Uncharacterized protein n=1 Tax=Vitis vinifera TaxID=29760 RepID=F6GSY7_VITVI
MDSGKKNKK